MPFDSDPFTLVERAPTVDEFLFLREQTGLGRRSRMAAEKGVGGGLYAVIIEHEGRAIGMGRIVGDGGTTFQVTDIGVLPDYRGKGLGLRIMSALMHWLEENVPETGFVSLIADTGSAPFYERFGFKVRPIERPGMTWKRQV
ncbi:GNAT family N-acetyltransferase [Microvirga alba]|uniref:GNAT family N-acetyltransferase n=1 Tax=Microvirga alba TaxID=2791025 RepID=A0A931FMQ1_9HYPH|nr:GNAT family N-acetyltransferase [Microvirga alba]MBF9233299.1 GNAT family N-acetyltransferase [Microvirga alba]